MRMQTDLAVGLHAFPAERAYENPTGQYPHQGAGRLTFAFAFNDVAYSELYRGSPDEKYQITEARFGLTWVEKRSGEHIVFEGAHIPSGAKCTGFIKSQGAGWDFEILGYWQTGELAYRIQPVRSAWAKQIIDKFPDVDFGLVEDASS